MSNGGGFAPLASFYLGFNACGIYCAGAAIPLFNITTVPTVWSLGRNDDLYDHTTFLANATTALASLTTRGVGGELRENLPSPVYPRRFLRIPGLSAADSQAIYDSLNSGGFLDALGYLLADPVSDTNWMSGIPARYAAFDQAIGAQLNCCYSEHNFFSDFDNKVLQFFGARHPPLNGRGAVQTLTRDASGIVELTIAADPGQTYELLGSPDLVTWTPLFTNTYSAGTFDFTDTAASGFTRRFYRTISP